MVCLAYTWADRVVHSGRDGGRKYRYLALARYRYAMPG